MNETFKKLWRFSGKRHSELIKALLLSFFRSAVSITEFLALIIAVRAVCGEISVSGALLKIILLTVFCICGNYITSYFEQTATLSCGFYTVADMRDDAGKVLRRMPLGFFSDSSSGKICSALTSSLSGVETAAAMVMVGIVSGIFSSLCLLLFMLFYDWRIGIISAAGMAAYLGIVGWQIKISRKNAPELQAAQSELSEAVLSFLQGINITKSFSFKNGDRKLRAAVQKSCEENLALTKKSMPSQYAAGICTAVFESIILLSSLYFCLGEGNADVVRLIVLIIYSFAVYSSLSQAGSMLSMTGLLDSGLSEAEELLNSRQLQQQMPLENAKSDEIVLDDVSFSYGENEVLHNISAVIKPGSTTALIGPSGSGKTTLCQLIARFRDVSSGSIRIGGADIRHMNEKELMKKISMVFQDVYLFEDTVLNNIRFGRPEAGIDEVREAARAACCDDFIMELPKGYDTVLSEGGCSLSGGERQRISIARAILKDSPIVILDEATSALDAENEHEILSAVRRLTENKTVIMIAHRIKTVRKADKIISLRAGHMVQYGSPEELQDSPGLYSDFLAARKEAAAWQLNV